MREKYNIKIENFEGPFDLLFHLIEKNKIDIYDIPIAVITDQYLDYLQAMQEMDLDVASEFLVMAATLLHIKSRMLLPKHKENVEEADEIDPREELIARLLEYKRCKELVVDLKEREKIQNMVYYKLPDIINMDDVKVEQFINLNPNDLLNAFKKILDKNEKEILHTKKAFTEILHREKVSVATKVREILKVLKNSQVIKFTSLFEVTPTKLEKVATFLAVLELIKLNKVIIEQSISFGDIIIYRNKKDNNNDFLQNE